MNIRELKNFSPVKSTKYGNIEIVICKDVLMKDSAEGWVQAVVYTGKDRYTGEEKTFCKKLTDFLLEFEPVF